MLAALVLIGIIHLSSSQFCKGLYKVIGASIEPEAPLDVCLDGMWHYKLCLINHLCLHSKGYSGLELSWKWTCVGNKGYQQYYYGYGCNGNAALSYPVNTTTYTVVCDSTSTCQYAIAKNYTTTCNSGDDWEQKIWIVNDCVEYSSTLSGIRLCDQTTVSYQIYASGDCTGNVVSAVNIIDANNKCSDIISCSSSSTPTPRPTTTTTLSPTKQPTKAPELCNGIYYPLSADASIYVIYPLHICRNGRSSYGTQWSQQYTCIGNIGYEQWWYGYDCEGNADFSDPVNTTKYISVCDASDSCPYTMTESYSYNNITDTCEDSFYQRAYVVNDCLEYNKTHSGLFACDGTGTMSLLMYESGDCSGNVLKTQTVFDGNDECNDMILCSSPLTPSPTSKQSTISTTNRPTAPTIPATPFPTNEFDAYSTYSSSDVNKPILIMGILLGTSGLIISIIFLCYYHKEIRHDAGMAKKGEALKESSWQDRAFIVLKVLDIGSDFMFASAILLKYGYNTIVVTMGWIAFLTGIIGAILFVVKFMLMRKIFHKIIALKKKRNKLNLKTDEDEIKEVVFEIRRRQSYLGFYDLLNASVEDVPQLTITLLFGVYTGFEDAVALANLAFTILTLLWCPTVILVGWCGWMDDSLHDEEEDKNNNNQSEMVPMTSNNDHPEGRIANNNSAQHNIVKESMHSVATDSELETPHSTAYSQGFGNNAGSSTSLHSPLPPGWRRVYTEDGRVYFYNDITKNSQWHHPQSTQSVQNTSYV